MRVRRQSAALAAVALLGATFVTTTVGPIAHAASAVEGWFSNGPGSASATAIAVDPVTRSTVYAGTAHGVYKSLDGGTSWARTSEGLPASRVRSLAIDESNSSVLFAGTDSAGLFRSADAGATWSPTPGVTSGALVAGVVADGLSVFVILQPNGYVESADGGLTWGAVSEVGDESNLPYVADVARYGSHVFIATQLGGLLHRGAPDQGFTQVRAGGFTAVATDPSGAVVAGGGSGVVRSEDFGVTWSDYGSVSGPVRDLVFAGTDLYAAGRGFWRRGASSWTSLGGPDAELYGAGVASSTQYVVASFVGGVLVTGNAGGTWGPPASGMAGGGVRAIARGAQGATRFLMAGLEDGSVYGSLDSGSTWERRSNGLLIGSPTTALVTVPETTTVYAATRDGIYRTDDGGGTWTPHFRPTYAVWDLEVDPHDPSVLYAATQRGEVHVITRGSPVVARFGTGLPDTNVWSVVADPATTPATLYAGTNSAGVFRSTDAGETWVPTAAGSTGSDVRSLALDLSTTPHTLWSGLGNGTAMRSTDPMAGYTPVSAGLPAGHGNEVHLSVDAGRVHAGVFNNNATAADGGVFRLAADGSSWTALTNTGLVDRRTRDVLVDPGSSALHAATGAGVFTTAIEPPPPPAGTPPTVIITAPTEAQVLEVDQVARFDFFCYDDVTLVSCDGDVAAVPASPGSLVDTTTPGEYRLRVIAVDDAGASTTAYADYTVVPSAPPSIEVTTPTDGARFTVGELVNADYLCADGLGSGIATCTGTVATGTPVDTSAVGVHSFTVRAVDRAGRETEWLGTFEVVAAGDTEPPLVWINAPAQGAVFSAGTTELASYACDDQAGSGIASCTGPVASESPIDMSVGEHVFEVVALDVAGNSSRLSVTYTVTGTPTPTDTTLPYALFRTPTHLSVFGTGTTHTVDYECVDPGANASGIASCDGAVADGASLDTSTPGWKTITVVVTDNAGNTRYQYVGYTVVDDRDGDGLSDQWETAGVDGNGDGIIDLRLDQAPYNASPDHRDLFVEMDYMTCGSTCSPGDRLSHAPQPGVVDDVTTAFANAPLANPDGSSGIRLHLLVDEAVPEVEMLSFAPTASIVGDDYDEIKGGPPGPCNGSFGTAVERASNTCAALLAAKNLVYRYGLFAHHYSAAPGSSGVGEYPGNDFLVTVGGSADAWDSAVGLRAAESGTVMHELGHTLGLGHGGLRNNVNCKPNYLSVMNYSFQVPDADVTRPLDYSRSALPTLRESALDESLGVQGPSGRNTVFGVQGRTTVASAFGPLDWDGDGIGNETVASNVNDVGSCFSFAGETLTGADDWANLIYSFVASPDFASGSRFTTRELITEEITAQDAVETATQLDFDNDGFNNLDDVCPGVADSAQRDIDADGVGDACDDENTVAIRVLPESSVGVRLKSKSVQVAVLSTDRITPTSILVASLRFGVNGTEAAASKCTTFDADFDGAADLVCHYPMSRTGFTVGPATGVLRGRLTSGQAVVGRQSFTVRN